MNTYRAVFQEMRTDSPRITYAIPVVAENKVEAVRLGRLRAAIEAPGCRLVSCTELRRGHR